MAPHGPSNDAARRHATVLYADISGFTALSEKLDPEDVTAIMNRVFDRLEGIVVGRGGIVSQYIGDCVLAVFGLTPGDRSPSRRAVEAAFEIRGAIEELNERGDVPTRLDVHTGINTGPVVAAEIGGEIRREFTVMGDAVTLAAQLEDASGKGQIYVGPLTYQETTHHFEYRRIELKARDAAGTPVTAYEVVAARPEGRRVKRDSERRQATVIFADIVGLEALSERLSADELTRLLNRCFGLIESIVRDFGGVVDKYVGQRVMALFGVPNAIENAPQQAINAAIEIRNRLAEFNENADLAVPLDAHIGVNTGLVIAGEIGGRLKRDFTVMGDTVNVASRLKDAAGHGAVYVGPETHRYTKDVFEYHALPPLSLPGKSEPLRTYELVSVKQHVHRVSATSADRMIVSELVGREHEVRQLRACITRTLAGEGGIVSVVGEAGLGKSRLVADVLTFEPLRHATVLEGRSTAIGQNLSFHPFVDLLRRWADMGDDDGETESLAKLASAVTAVAPDEIGEILPFIATLMGIRVAGAYAERLQGIDGEALEKLIFRNMRRLFERVAATRPLLLVFEDLHWADGSSVHLLETLLRLVVDHAVLVVLVFRPDYHETAERVMRGVLENLGPRHTEVRVEPLTVQESTELVQKLLKTSLSHTMRELVTRKAEGNPFYIEEVVRALIDQGAVVYRDGRFQETAKINSVVIPGTIQEVIMARVDRLDESTRHLLQVASVIGRNFYYRIIADILRRQGEVGVELDHELAALIDKQLLRQRRAQFGFAAGGGTAAQELEYVFTHALAQETIYESILQKTRKEFHLTVAHSIESLFGDRLIEFHGMLAYHYSRAEDLEKAEQHLFKAGEEAARSAASSEALNFFREAARIYFMLHGEGGDPRRKALLEKNIGFAMLNTGHLTDCITHFDEALRHLGQPLPDGGVMRQIRFLVDLLAVLYRLYMPEAQRSRPVSEAERQAFDIMFRRFKALTTSDPQRMFVDNMGTIRRMHQRDRRTIPTACVTYVVGGAAFAYSGASFAVSRRFLRKAQELVRPGDASDELGCGFFRFVVNFLEGKWKEEPGIAPEVLELGLKYGVLWDVNSYLGLECDRQLRQGRFADARDRLRQLADLRDLYGYEFAAANHDGMTAILLLEERRLEAALAAVERYHAGRHEDALRVLALGTRAKTELLLGAHDAARATLEKVGEILPRAGLVPPWHLSAYTVAQLRWDLVALEAAEPDGATSVRRLRAQARKDARRALRVAKAVAGVRPETYRLVGRLHWLSGRPRKALARWARAVDEAERLDAAPELARTCLEIGLRTQRVRSAGVDADAQITRARALLGQLGLVWDLAQLDAGAMTRI